MAESHCGIMGSCLARPQAPWLSYGRAVFLGGWGGSVPAQGIGTEGSAPESPNSSKGLIDKCLTPLTPPVAKDSAQQIAEGGRTQSPFSKALVCESAGRLLLRSPVPHPSQHPGVLAFWAKGSGKWE